MRITRGFCEYGYKHSFFSPWSTELFIQLRGNRPLIEGLDPLEFHLTKTPAILRLGRTPESAVGEVAAQSRRSFRVTSVNRAHDGHHHVQDEIHMLFRFHFNIILNFEFMIFKWPTHSVDSIKMFMQFSSPHVPHVLLFGLIISYPNYKLWTHSHYVTLSLKVSLPASKSNSKVQSPLKCNLRSVEKLKQSP